FLGCPRSDNPAVPSSQQGDHPVENRRVIINADDEGVAEPAAPSRQYYRLGQGCARHFGGRRFYLVDVTPTLFGDWTVLREWGRRGSPGTLRHDTISTAPMPTPPSGAASSGGCDTAIPRLPDRDEIRTGPANDLGQRRQSASGA